MSKLKSMQMKTVVLYNSRRVRPETVAAIRDAEDGDMIPVIPEELDSFMSMTFFQPELETLAKGTPGVARAKAKSELPS